MQNDTPGQVKNNDSLFASSVDISSEESFFTADFIAVLYPPNSPVRIISAVFPESPNNGAVNIPINFFKLLLNPVPRKKYVITSIGNTEGTTSFRELFNEKTKASVTAFEFKIKIKPQKTDIIVQADFVNSFFLIVNFIIKSMRDCTKKFIKFIGFSKRTFRRCA